jgi:hypothetical protein
VWLGGMLLVVTRGTIADVYKAVTYYAISTLLHPPLYIFALKK